ncbi:MAG: hypothetical protein WAX48_02905, partial [Desulfosalsimonadaceae bacterium]
FYPLRQFAPVIHGNRQARGRIAMGSPSAKDCCLLTRIFSMSGKKLNLSKKSYKNKHLNQMNVEIQTTRNSRGALQITSQFAFGPTECTLDVRPAS